MTLIQYVFRSISEILFIADFKFWREGKCVLT